MPVFLHYPHGETREITEWDVYPNLGEGVLSPDGKSKFMVAGVSHSYGPNGGGICDIFVEPAD